MAAIWFPSFCNLSHHCLDLVANSLHGEVSHLISFNSDYSLLLISLTLDTNIDSMLNGIYFRAFCGCESKDNKEAEAESREGIEAIVREEYKSLGPIRFAEVANMVVFLLLVLLWFFRGPGFMDGYDTFFEPE